MTQNRLIVGIAGGSGSGKTTIANRVAESLPSEHVRVLRHDHYYRDHPEMTMEERNRLNFDHPESLETGLLVTHLQHLRAGNAVDAPRYDFTTHRRMTETVRVDAAPIVVVEGILTFHDEKLRNEFDIKIYVDTDPDIRLIRRVRRDMEQRGRTFDSVRRQYYETVRPMHIEFVEPTKRWADLIIPEGGNNEVALQLVLARLREVL